MSSWNTTKRCCTGWANAFAPAVIMALLLAAAPRVQAQQHVEAVPLPRSLRSAAADADTPRIPVVPLRPPRPAEGVAADQQWPAGPDPAAAPMASFLGPVSRNDAVIEVIVGQSRLLTVKAELANEQGTGVIAVGDPTVIEFDVLPNPRMVRLTGRRAGVTDLSFVTPDGQTFGFEVHVVYDLALLQAQLKQVFPDAQLRLFQIREHLAVEGQARSIRQVDQILQTLEVFLASVQVPSSTAGQESEDSGRATPSGRRSPAAPSQDSASGAPAADGGTAQPAAEGATGQPGQPTAVPEPGGKPNVQGTIVGAQIINLLRVPGVQQVMLQVRIAELNRTALRQVGADWEFRFGTGNFLNTFIGGGANGGTPTLTGVLPSADLDFALRVLRTNQLLSVLAEPNLVALSGQKANFLAGGEFPVPVPQNSGGGTTITIEFKKFGVQLEFEPFVLEDETVRLTVNSEESSPDSTNAVEVDGYFVPGINTRRASTTVEMRQGQSLAIAGLLRVSVDANTKRIPGLGDLPYIGPLFSNTTHQRQEKELLILVTPYLVAPMNADQMSCLPGEEIKDPNDLEFYLLNRIEGRTGHDVPATRNWDDPWNLRRLMHLESRSVSGPFGLSPCE
jgi:pilus assembly protein CpaC